MARKRRGPETAPARNDVYVMMLLLTVVVTAIGSALLAMECNDYEWESEPTAGPAVTIPDIPVGRPTGDDPAAANVSVVVPRPALTRPADLVASTPAEPPILPSLPTTVPVVATIEALPLR